MINLVLTLVREVQIRNLYFIFTVEPAGLNFSLRLQSIVFSLEKRQLRGDFIANCFIAETRWLQSRGQPLPPGNSARMRGKGLKLCQGRFSWGIRKYFSTERLVMH